MLYRIEYLGKHVLHMFVKIKKIKFEKKLILTNKIFLNIL
jgi:hypothetical protein